MNVSECDSFNECHNSENVRLDSGCTTCHVVGWPDKYTDNARTLEFTQASSQCTALQKTGIISHHISQCCLFMPTGWGVQGLFISRHFQRLGGWRRILISWLEGQTIELVAQVPHTLPPSFHTLDSHALFT